MRIVFHNGAERDLAKAFEYYEEQRSSLADEFAAEVERYVRLIAENPKHFPVCTRRGARKCVLRRFPYSLFFYEQPDRVLIVAAAHHSRKPLYWLKRTE